MYVTPLNFNQVLEKFYRQDKYDYLLLFVSSFYGSDRAIIHEIVDNVKRIDRITGKRICFFYFVKETYDRMNEKLVRWVKDISDWEPYYGEGVSETMETVDDICRQFGILRSNLPAFILVSQDLSEEPQVYSIWDYQDFECFLTPLNIMNSYIEDMDSVFSRYERERRKVLNESVLNESVDELLHIRNTAIERLNIALDTNEGEYIIEELKSQYRYSDAVLKVWQLVRTRGTRLSRILEHIRYEIHERGFDVFISCKSQDYGLAHDLFDFLVNNGYKPFLADSSIKGVGIDQYTALIGEVISVCPYMVVFATDARYLETPFVAADWHTFINDINTGRKPNAKIVSILSPDIDPHCLPILLREKKCFTTENYKDESFGLISFLSRLDEEIKQLKEEIDGAYFHIRSNTDKLLWHHRVGKVYWFIDRVDRDHQQIVSCLNDYYRCSYDIRKSELAELSARVRHTREEWEDEIRQLTKEIEKEKEEATWNRAINNYGSVKLLNDYLEQYPYGIHYFEALEALKYLKCLGEKMRKTDFAPISFSPSIESNSEESRQSIEGSLEEGTSIGSTLSTTIRAIISGIRGWFCGKTNNTTKYNEVYSSIFAPAEVRRNSHMLVQVYLHLFKETERVKSLAQESDKDAERRDYIPLQCKLKKGDKVDVLLNLYGETLLMSDKKNVVWQGSFTKCSFDYFVPKDIDVDELSCVALLSVNGVPVGEMRFITKIVEEPRKLNPEIIAHKYNKVFISYSHQDESKVNFLHEGLELGSVPHFFDRKYLKAGDVFPQVIRDYINSADLFILCWSENASKSEYVQKERLQALERAFPQVQPEKAAKLRIYPMSIEPRAELPSDMKDNYHFGEM